MKVLYIVNLPIFSVKRQFEFISQPLFSSTSPIKENQTPIASPSFHSAPLIHIPTTSIPLFQTLTPNPSPAMDSRFAPLVLPAQLHDLPQAYSTRIKTHSFEGDITAQQHLDRFNDFYDLEEVDHEDAKLRLFAQKISREVKKCFRGLQVGSINDFQQFETVFLGKWEKKRNYLQLLTQYNNLKRGMNE